MCVATFVMRRNGLSLNEAFLNVRERFYRDTCRWTRARFCIYVTIPAHGCWPDQHFDGLDQRWSGDGVTVIVPGSHKSRRGASGVGKQRASM